MTKGARVAWESQHSESQMSGQANRSRDCANLTCWWKKVEQSIYDDIVREHKSYVTSPRLERWQPLLSLWTHGEREAASYSVWLSRHIGRLGTQSREGSFFFKEQKRKRSKEAKTEKRKVGYKCIWVLHDNLLNVNWQCSSPREGTGWIYIRWGWIYIRWNSACSTWPLLPPIPSNPNPRPPLPP